MLVHKAKNLENGRFYLHFIHVISSIAVLAHQHEEHCKFLIIQEFIQLYLFLHDQGFHLLNSCELASFIYREHHFDLTLEVVLNKEVLVHILTHFLTDISGILVDFGVSVNAHVFEQIKSVVFCQVPVKFWSWAQRNKRLENRDNNFVTQFGVSLIIFLFQALF
jgi:hypothetical protein